MIATITDVQSKDERNQVIDTITRCNGTVLAPEEGEAITTIRAEFRTTDDQAEVDVQLADLGFDVEWDDADISHFE